MFGVAVLLVIAIYFVVLALSECVARLAALMVICCRLVIEYPPFSHHAPMIIQVPHLEIKCHDDDDPTRRNAECTDVLTGGANQPAKMANLPPYRQSCVLTNFLDRLLCIQ
jgi:hypothetical protein